MGNCNPISIKPDRSSIDNTSIYYLNRAEALALYVTQKNIQKTRFSNKKYFYKDSAIGYVSDSSIIIAGGTNRKGKLSKTTYFIDLESLKITKLAPLPIPSKLGSLLLDRNSIFYAGGIIENNEKITGCEPFKGAPLMKYNFKENFWEIIVHQNQFSNDDHKVEGSDFSLGVILYPGTFILHSKIYYYAGKIIYPFECPNNNVYSIDINTEEYVLKIEPFTFPLLLINPVSSSNDRRAFIYGGTSLAFEPSNSCYIFNTRKGFIETKTHFLCNNENYPPKFNNDYIIALSFPHFAVRFKNSSGWLHFNVSLHELKKSQSLAIKPNTKQQRNLTLPIIRKGTLQLPRFSSPNSVHPCSLSMHQKKVSNSFINEVKLRMVLLSPEQELANIEEKLNNSLNNSQIVQGTERKGKIIVPQELNVAMIISEENDGYILLPRRKTVQFLGQASIWLNGKELNPMEFNILSHNLGFKQEVTIYEIKKAMNKIIIDTLFNFDRVLKFSDVISKIFSKPKPKHSIIENIINIIELNSCISGVPKGMCILFLTRVIKTLDWKLVN
ncbi:hypothetical protein SteCoe_34866 [Stentor coeruleus]|uniref:Uncharacterized protein n=1 Tax=Stentor coeruleus TaxID=5963 RepID=A0A1R2ATM3_9CILI|nr:hypothetical protein SteCoe_34866 [Stentor coeruleus]